jgi:hypothetical protein
MITRQTVFVLGAGASYPYGFPTGEGLVNQIISMARTDPTPDGFVYNGCNETDVKRFANDLADSDAPSVDAFLEHRPDFLKIGKLAICMALLPQEKDVALGREWRQSTIGKMGWYHYLWKIMAAEKGGFGENQIKFVTMNYDRSLERYFFLRLRAKHQYSNDKECLEELRKIESVHVYGSLGDEDFAEDPFNRPTPSPAEIQRSANRLRIIYEETTGVPYLEQAKSILRGADTICFLGYGFHHLNNERLGLVSLAKEDSLLDSQGESGRKWLASRYGMSDVEFDRLTRGFTHRFSRPGNPRQYAGHEHQGTLEVLRYLPVIE